MAAPVGLRDLGVVGLVLQARHVRLCLGARLCLRLSQRAERISDLAFVQTNQSEGRNHTCPAGFELVGEAGGPAAGLGDVTGAVDLWDGVGGNARVFLCARREGGLLRANLTSAAPGGCGGECDAPAGAGASSSRVGSLDPVAASCCSFSSS